MVFNHRLQSYQPKDKPMSAVALASAYARRLVESEARRSGDPIKEALAPVARRVKAAPSTLWSLLFRPPKQVCADLLAALETAVESELIQEIKALEHELVTLRSTTRRSRPGTIQEVEASLVRLRAALRDEAQL